MEHTSTGGRQLQTVLKAFDIVHELEARDGATVTELAEAFDESKGTVHTYLNTLDNEGYVRKAGNEYDVTLKWFKFGSQIRDKEALYRHGKHPADELARRSGELIYLAAEQQGLIYYLYPAQGENAAEPATPVGRCRPLHAVSAGKVLLAEMPKSRRERILRDYELEPITENTIVERDTLRRELDQITDQGYALNDEEEFLGSRSVATSIGHPNGGIAGAITASGPTSRFDEERIEEIIPLLKETANQIEINFQREY